MADIRRAEDELIAGGVSAESLMEIAGRRIAAVILSRWKTPGLCVAYLGKGNNAGDALVVLGYLREKGWRIAVRYSCLPSEGSRLLALQWERLTEGGVVMEWNSHLLSGEEGPVVLLDGLVGLGAGIPLRGTFAGLAAEMNACRRTGRARVVAIDYPSGVEGDTGEVSDGAVIADVSAVIGGMKKGLLADSATGHVGRIHLIPLPGMETGDSKEGEVPDKTLLASLLGPRPYEWYKGSAGRVIIVAGSPGMTGAARLCAEAALRGGAGMVTVLALPDIYPLLAVSMPPEIMVRPVQSWREALRMPGECLLLGPGLGAMSAEREEELLELIRSFAGKMVLDADALNALARRGGLPLLSERALLTPHVGEMGRLLPALPGENRRDWAERFTQSCEAALLLKGARTLIARRGHTVRYNISGGPAMGTAGQGDVLSGVCAALCAQGLHPYDGAALGAWLCGRASELALEDRESEQSLTAGATSEYLGRAFNDLCLQPF